MSPLPHRIFGGSKERIDAKNTLGDGQNCLRWFPQIRRFLWIRKTCHGSSLGGCQTKGHWRWSPFISSELVTQQVEWIDSDLSFEPECPVPMDQLHCCAKPIWDGWGMGVGRVRGQTIHTKDKKAQDIWNKDIRRASWKSYNSSSSCLLSSWPQKITDQLL